VNHEGCQSKLLWSVYTCRQSPVLVLLLVVVVVVMCVGEERAS
jgi:hypothetical protein